MSTHRMPSYQDQDVAAALKACRQHFLFALCFEFCVNILLLAYPIFMIQVFDRVIDAKSWETLVALLIGLRSPSWPKAFSSGCAARF